MRSNSGAEHLLQQSSRLEGCVWAPEYERVSIVAPREMVRLVSSSHFERHDPQNEDFGSIAIFGTEIERS
eukprot:scaffold198540_cov29-Tisochrysis_lutea.AAC.5